MGKYELHDISQWIKTRASELGFDACGIAPAGHLPEDDGRLRNWLSMDYQGEMSYLERNHEKRTDPRELLPGAKSVISFFMNYFPAENPSSENNFKISKYAYGKDYHLVIKNRLKLIIKELQGRAGTLQARAFTDSAPVLERAWAEKSGLGWIGKNTCLIHPKLGSFVFLAEIITDLELEYDNEKVNDLCGGCTKCIEACPTGAITGPRLLDARKCISYLTIEYRGELPEGQENNFNDWIFGCDICQDVCPWNRKAKPHQEQEFNPHPHLLLMNKEQWKNLTREEFDQMFENSAVQRTRFEGLKRNISYLAVSLLFFMMALTGKGSENFFSRPDTVPPPPPEMTDTITGPSFGCPGASSVFSIAIPLACSCEWAINGIVQPETSPELTVTWDQPGLVNLVSVATICPAGNGDPLFKNVMVWYQPQVDLGNDTSIVQGETLTLDAGNPGSDYIWSTGETSQTIEVNASGDYSVTVSNFCGIDLDTIQVSVVIGTEEHDILQKQPEISVSHGKIIFLNLPHHTGKIQFISLNGKLLYETRAVKEIFAPVKGLMLIRIISEEENYTKKVLIM